MTAPDAFSACTRRPRSNTPLQSLTMLNDEASFEFATALGERVRRERKDDKSRLDRAFQLCLSRQPAAGEMDRLQKLVEDLRPEGEEKTWATVARVLLNLDETITRE